jgi:hypothetical protein
MNVQGDFEIHLEGEGDPANSKHYKSQSTCLDVQTQVGVTKHIGSHQAIQTDLL